MTTQRVLPRLARDQTLYRWRAEEPEYFNPSTWVRVKLWATDVEAGRDILVLEGEGYYSTHDVTIVTWGRKDILNIGIRDRATGEERWLRHHWNDRVQTYRRRDEALPRIIESPNEIKVGDRVLAPSPYAGTTVTKVHGDGGRGSIVQLEDDRHEVTTSVSAIRTVERMMT